jgi:hypothetical protein
MPKILVNVTRQTESLIQPKYNRSLAHTGPHPRNLIGRTWGPIPTVLLQPYQWRVVLLGHLCGNLPHRVEGAGVPIDRRAACLDMPDSK